MCILQQDLAGMHVALRTMEAPQANNHHNGNSDDRTSEDGDTSLLLQALNEALLCPQASHSQLQPRLPWKREPIIWVSVCTLQAELPRNTKGASAGRRRDYRILEQGPSLGELRTPRMNNSVKRTQPSTPRSTRYIQGDFGQKPNPYHRGTLGK